MAVTDKLAQIIGGNLADGVAKIISLFKVDPTVALEKKVELDELQLQMQQKTADAISAELLAGGQIIAAEAKSQSWLPRNVRPLLMLLWGLCITFNVLVPVFARYWVPGLQPLPLDPWVYKLTAIGFTGYVTARSVEKCLDKDN